MPLNVGLITGEYPPMEGGVGAFTRELAQALAAAGHTIHVITSKGAAPRREPGSWRELTEPVDEGFALVHPTVRRWRFSSLAAIADLSQRYELDLLNVQYQAAAYDMRSPAINLLPWRMKGMLRTVVTFHDLRVPYLFPKAGRLRPMAVRFMARQAHGVIATNSADHQSLAGILADPDRLVKIPIGSNIRSSQANPSKTKTIREQLGLANSHRLLGYFGFLNRSKGADTLIKALAGLEPEFHLLFIGGRHGSSDPTNNELFAQELRHLAAELELGNRVHWTGYISEQEVSDHLHAAELMVMPYQDGASLRRGTMMAVLAHGRPLLTTEPEAATPELVHGLNAHFVPAGKVDSLAKAIRMLARDSAYRELLAEGGKQLSREFAWPGIAAQTAHFYQRLLTGAGGRQI